MPWGVPPSHEVVGAVGDYCTATIEQVAEIAQSVSAPVDEYLCGCERFIKGIKDRLKSRIGQKMGHLDRDVEDVIQPIIDSINWYVAHCTAQTNNLTSIYEGYERGLRGVQYAPEEVRYISQQIAAEDGEVPVSERPEMPFITGPPLAPAPPPPGPKLFRPPTEVTAKLSDLKVPEPPKSLSGVPCPTAPQAVAGLGAPIGSSQWCETVEQLLTLMESVGAELVKWEEKIVVPGTWSQWVESVPIPDDWWDIAKQIGRAILKALAVAVKIGGQAIQVVTDLIRCAWYYTRVVSPMKRPDAYLGLLFLRNLLAWVRDSRIGSQSYLGFTLGLSISIPALEDTLDMLMRYLAPNEAPTLADATQLWLRGYPITDDQLDCIARVNGVRPEWYRQMRLAEQEQLSVDEAVQYARRNGQSEHEQLHLLRQLGWVDDDYAKARLSLYDHLPTITDHLHWLRRNVFDDRYVQQYGLMDGFTERFWPRFGPDLRALGMKEEYAKLHYAAHWIQPSPTEMREMLHRLRPGKPGVTQSFTLVDYKNLLAEQDVAPHTREWWLQTAYKVPALSYLVQMYRFGLLTTADMLSYHQDLGYKHDDAKRFAAIDEFQARRINSRMGSGWSPAAMRRALAVHQLTEAQVREEMTAQGYTTAQTDQLVARAGSDLQYRALSRGLSTQLTLAISQVREGIRVGVMTVDDGAAALTGLGIDSVRAKGIAESEDTKARVALVKEAVSKVHRAYITGEVDETFGREALGSLGIVEPRLTQYLLTWTQEMTPQRRRLMRQQIVTELAEGAIDLADAQARLANLGYSSEDTALAIGDAVRKTVTSEAALEYAQTLPGRQRSAHLAQLGQQTLGLSRRIVAQLQRQEPVAKLVKWGKDGRFSEMYFRQRLSLYGYPESSIEQYVLDVTGGDKWPQPGSAAPPNQAGGPMAEPAEAP